MKSSFTASRRATVEHETREEDPGAREEIIYFVDITIGEDILPHGTNTLSKTMIESFSSSREDSG